MAPIYLNEVEQTAKAGPAGEQFADMETHGVPVPQIPTCLPTSRA